MNLNLALMKQEHIVFKINSVLHQENKNKKK